MAANKDRLAQRNSLGTRLPMCVFVFTFLGPSSLGVRLATSIGLRVTVRRGFYGAVIEVHPGCGQQRILLLLRHHSHIACSTARARTCAECGPRISDFIGILSEEGAQGNNSLRSLVRLLEDPTSEFWQQL